MLLEVAKEIKLEQLLSKTVTLPLLCYFIYKILIAPVNKAAQITTPNTHPDNIQKNKTQVHSEEYGPLGVRIEPVASSFDWEKQAPLKYRPFHKGPYKLTMGLHNIPPSEWLLVEDTYKQYTDLKAKYREDKELSEHILFLADNAVEPTIEFYEMTLQFLMERYPMYFEKRGDKFYNKIRDEYIPYNPRDVKDPKQLNYYLSTQIEEDYVILFPDAKNYNTDEYIFKGGIFGFANGFDPLKRAYVPLTTVHGPVPDYKTKLRPQMNKIFDKFKAYNFARRNNWSIQTHTKLCNITLGKGEEGQELKPLDPETMDFKREVFFRTERQVVTRLPRTGAIAFTVRTYCTPMSEIKEEGLAEELIGGIQGLQETAIGQYKRKPEWGDAVIAYLSGASDGADKPWIGPLQ